MSDVRDGKGKWKLRIANEEGEGVLRRSSSNGKCDAGILVRREWRTEDEIRTRIRTGGEIKGGAEERKLSVVGG